MAGGAKPSLREIRFLLIGGFLMSLHAGFINAAAYFGPWKSFVTHQTGNTTRMFLNIILGEYEDMLFFFMIVFCFCLGSMITGMLFGVSQFKITPRHGFLLMLESVVLMCVSILLEFYGEESWTRWIYPLIALAAGLQNGMCTGYSGAVIRITHLSGITTDIGLILGQAIRYRFIAKKRREVPIWRLKILVLIWLGFGCGVLLGGFTTQRIQNHALLIPSITLGLTGFLYVMAFTFNLIQSKTRKARHSTADMSPKPEQRPDPPRVSLDAATYYANQNMERGDVSALSRFVETLKHTGSDSEGEEETESVNQV